MGFERLGKAGARLPYTPHPVTGQLDCCGSTLRRSPPLADLFNNLARKKGIMAALKRTAGGDIPKRQKKLVLDLMSKFDTSAAVRAEPENVLGIRRIHR